MDKADIFLSNIIEELKRLQVEHGNLPVRKTEHNSNGIHATWPELRLVNKKVYIVFD